MSSKRRGLGGYYLSSYGIAVKNGFEGTEEEWLETLKGEQGVQGETGRGIESVEMTTDGRLVFDMTDGTQEEAEESVYGTMEALAERAEDAAEAAEAAAASVVTSEAPTLNASHISVASGGHFRLIDKLTGKDMNIYDANGDVVKTVDGSEYIRITSTSQILTVIVPYNASVTFSNSEFYLYIYNQNFEVNWSILNYTHSSGEKNRFTGEVFCGMNGMQITGIPAGYYVRAAIVKNANIQLGLWDGQHFGIPFAASPNVLDTVNGTVKKVIYPEDGSACIALPTYGQFLIAKPGYTFLRLYTLVGKSTRHDVWNRPTQILRLTGITSANSPKNAVIVKDYNYQNGEYSKECLSDVSDAVVMLDYTHTWSCQKPTGYAGNAVLKRAKALTTDFVWTPAADNLCLVGDATKPYEYYKRGVFYRGVPYKSRWTTATCVGWHISKQTFMSAVKDPDSAFYTMDEKPTDPGHFYPYYSLVCSSFSMLVAGFDYPETNFGMVHDPNLLWEKHNQPAVGELVTNGTGHCFVVLENYFAAEDNAYAVKTVESGSPSTRVLFDSIPDTFPDNGIGKASSYINNYVLNIKPKYDDPRINTPYDIYSYTEKPNLTVVPFRGDQFVYTTKMDVTFNIKSSSITRMYYQPVTFPTNGLDHGKIVSAKLTGEAKYVDFEAGTSQIVLRSKNGSGGSWTGLAEEDLIHGAVYCVWGSVGDATPTAPGTSGNEGDSVSLTNVAFFEWHDLTQPDENFTYSIVDGTLNTQSEFWYLCTRIINRVDRYKRKKPVTSSGGAGNACIPYELPRPVNMDPTAEDGTVASAKSDYSRYRERYYMYKMVNGENKPIQAVFKKGKLGAYTLNIGYEGSEDGDDEEDPEEGEDD